MVQIEEQPNAQCIVLTPNRSMSWRGNQIVIASLAFISLLIGIGFALIGAWVILPFAGLEILSLSGALYYVSWKLTYREVICFGKDEISIQKGHYAPRQSWSMQRDAVLLQLEPATHAWGTPSIHLQHQQEQIELGEFLNADDCKALLARLRAQGLIAEIVAETVVEKGKENF